MKTIKYFSSIVLIAFVFTLFFKNANSQRKPPKQLTSIQDKANKMIKKGAIAVVGIAVTDASRPDIGKRKAIASANQLIAEANRVKVEATTHSFFEEIGVGKNSENNDLFNTIVDLTTSNLNKGGMVNEFTYYKTRENRKEGTATYLVLYYVSPKTLYDNLEKAIKGSKESLYQQFRDSEVKKEHDSKIKEFEKEFGLNKD